MKKRKKRKIQIQLIYLSADAVDVIQSMQQRVAININLRKEGLDLCVDVYYIRCVDCRCMGGETDGLVMRYAVAQGIVLIRLIEE